MKGDDSSVDQVCWSPAKLARVLFTSVEAAIGESSADVGSPVLLEDERKRWLDGRLLVSFGH